MSNTPPPTEYSYWVPDINAVEDGKTHWIELKKKHGVFEADSTLTYYLNGVEHKTTVYIRKEKKK